MNRAGREVTWEIFASVLVGSLRGFISHDTMRIFLSYANADALIAHSLAQALTTEGFEVWDAANQLLPGANIHLEVGKALERSQAMVVLLSPDAINSSSVLGEVDYALTSLKFRDRLIPVLIRPTVDVPWILERLQFIDATKGDVKIARRIAGVLRNVPAAA